MNLARTLLALAPTIFVPTLAAAQTWVQSDRAEPFIPIGSIPGIGGVSPFTLIANGSFTPDDEGFAPAIPLGFSFNFLGTTVSTIGVSSNGWIAFTDQSLGSQLSNSAPGSSADPNNIVAVWWDDLAFTSGSYGTIGTAPNRIFVVEFTTFSFWTDGGSDGGSAQVWIFEGPEARFEVRYGGSLSSTSYAASNGWEGASGMPNGTFVACGTSCSSANFNSLVNRAFRVEFPQRPELTADFATFPRGATPGTQALGMLTLSNSGIQTATTVLTNVYLSTDDTLDPSDAFAGSTMDDLPTGPSNVQVTIDVPPGLAVGNYNLLAEVDADRRYTEIDESDNVAVGPLFATGPDLRPVEITTSQPGINPGELAQFDVTISQDGAPFADQVELRVFTSQDQLFDQNDRELATQTVTLGGAASETVQISGTLPSLPPGSYYAIAQIDPNGLVTETTESNNTYVGSTTFQTGPDFAIASVAVPQPISPGGTAGVVVTISSLSVPFNGPVSYRLYASTDASYDAMDDNLGTFAATFAGEPSLADSESVTIPASLGAGRFYLIAWVDPTNAVTEVDEANNRGASAAPLVVGPEFGIDAATFTPNTIEVGDELHVQGTLRSTGVAHTGNTSVRVYISSDDVFDPGDDAVHEELVFLAGLATTAFDFTFSVPRASPFSGDAVLPAIYRVFVVADATNLIPEADDTDNHLLASGTLTIQGSDLRIASMSGEPVAFAGRTYEVEITIENEGEADARGFRRVYYLSEDQSIRIFDDQIGISGTATIAAGASQTFVDVLDIPTITATATLYLGVIVDLFGVVPDRNPNNNIGRILTPISVVFPIPNMTAQIVETPTAAAAGEDFSITRLLRNDGVAPSGPFEYSYYLSNNPVISTDDLLIGTFSSDVMDGGDDYSIDLVNVPSTLAAGLYYVGIIVDPMDLVDEVSEDDNTALGQQLPVFEGAIRFITNTLPNAVVGVPYEVGVYAAGGPLPLEYSVQQGQLPEGLTLDSISGILSGTPSEEGLFAVTLRASAGTAYTDRAFSFRVVAPTVALDIATPALPTGFAQRPYEATLVAVGGTPPYQWSAITTLPKGLELSVDGVLSGTPETPVALPVTFRVRDALGASKSKDLALNISNANLSLEIIQFLLPTAIVGLPYCEPATIMLEAKNGMAPYSWSVIGASPPGLSLAPDGALCGTPERAGSFPMLVRAQDQSGLFDTSLFIVEVDDGNELAVSTFSLEPAQVGKPYAQSITAIRGVAPHTWSVVEEWGQLPDGLELGEDGMLSGTPITDGTYAFVVQVVDAQLRSDTQPLSIQVLPAPETTVEEGGCGCSAAETQDAPLASFAIFALLGLALFRRRRRWIGFLAALAIAGSSNLAEAQFIPGTPYVMSSETITYQPCVSPTVLTTDVDDGAYPVTIPFEFRFYDDMPTTLSASSNGAIAFPSGTGIPYSNQVPGSSTLDGFIAPMWDDLRLYSANTPVLGWIVSGAAPNRTLTICWENVSRLGSTGMTFSFQIRLFEGRSGRVEIDYGPVNGTGSFNGTMAMEDPLGGRPIFLHPSMCTDSCTQTELASLSNTRLTLVQDPGIEVVALGVSGPEIAFLGAQTSVSVEVANLNANPVGPFTISVEAGTGPDVQSPVVIGSTEVSLNGFSSQAISVPTVLPPSLGEASVHLAATVDSGGVIAEVNENNNRVVSAAAVRLLQGKADLSVDYVTTTATTPVDAGGTLTTYTTITNIGGEPANGIDVAVMLSSNPVVSPQDVELGRFTVTLAPGQSVTSTDTVTVPAQTNSGIYYVGAFADPNGALDELSKSNNGLAHPTPVVVQGGTLAIVTSELPDAYVDEIYSGLLTATGGDGTREWSVVQGTLPDGLDLVPGSGVVFGRPQRAETQNVTIRVESGSASAERQYTIVVNDPEEPLTIVTRSVASAVVGQEYSFELIATGGSGGDLTWTAEGLPEGIALVDDVLAGTPLAAGQSTIDLTVTDGVETASRQVELTVRENANLLIVPAPLSTASFGVPYEAQLLATGGVPPINWLLEIENLPAGIELGLDGKLTGTPMEVGRFRFAVQARDSATGALNATDVNSFELEVLDVEGFNITTTSLPDAVINSGYEAVVTAEGGLMPYEWKIIEGRVPGGLVPSDNPATGEFRFLGVPTDTGISNLLVQVVDSQQRKAVRALSIRVVEPIVTAGEEGGCSCSTEPRSLAGIWVSLCGLAFLLFRRRASVLLGISMLLASAPAFAQSTPVPGTAYHRTDTANPYTPLSNPTIIWTSADEEEAAVPLPFMFRFYDEDVTGNLTVGSNGALILSPGEQVSLTNPVPGSSSSPNNFIAPFWDDLEVAVGYVGYQIDGVAPNRTLTVEWNTVEFWSDPSVTMSYQVRMFEGRSARVQIDYGAITGSGGTGATMAMEDQNGARPIYFHPGGCGNSCTVAELQSLANTRIDLVQDPGVELIANSVVAPEFGFLGAQTSIEVGVQNLHGNTIGPFTIQVLAGTGQNVENPVTIGSIGISLSPFQHQTVQVPAIFDPSLGENPVYLRVNVDSDGIVAEVDETNNSAVSDTPTRLLRGRADLSVESVTTDVRSVSAGGTLTIYSTVTNVGGETASNVSVGLMLSSNPVISPQDLELDRYVVTLASQESFNATTTISLEGINSGVYYAGALADTDHGVDELSEANNGLAAFSPVMISGGTLAVTTTELPAAHIRQSYTALLSAVGGEESYRWELVQGRLPAGLGVTAGSGELYGRATTAEMQTFTVRVTSGDQTADATLTLVVSDPAEPLTIVTRAVPGAVVGQEYNFRLVATGGSDTSSLAWSAADLPAGMSVSAGGILSGSVELAGSATISVSVTDGIETATRDLLLRSSENVNLLIVPALLSTARYNEPYSQQLTSTGGIAPITWLLLGNLPEGMDLMPDGTLSGTPVEVGTFLFGVEARDAGPGGSAAKDVNNFQLEVLDELGDFAIATASLPKAFVETGYEARIAASGGLPPYEWTIEDGRLPMGLVPSFDQETNEFRISGAAIAPSITNLLVTVVDSQGRTARRAFALIVEEAPVVELAMEKEGDGGCGCAATPDRGASLLGLGLLLGLFLFRRRS